MREIKDLKLKKLSDIREMEVKAIKSEIGEASKNLYVLKMKKHLGEQKQTHLAKALRRYIAQLETVVNEKNLNLN